MDAENASGITLQQMTAVRQVQYFATIRAEECLLYIQHYRSKVMADVDQPDSSRAVRFYYQEYYTCMETIRMSIEAERVSSGSERAYFTRPKLNTTDILAAVGNKADTHQKRKSTRVDETI